MAGVGLELGKLLSKTGKLLLVCCALPHVEVESRGRSCWRRRGRASGGRGSDDGKDEAGCGEVRWRQGR